MSNLKNCPKCGGENLASDRFCGECGFDTQTSVAVAQPLQPEKQTAADQSKDMGNIHQSHTVVPASPQQIQVNPQLSSQPANRNALIILVTILMVVFLGGGGLYWWFNKGEDGGKQVADQAGRQEKTATPQASTGPLVAQQDLSRASIYLPEEGLKCEFFANYPDGTSGPVERYNARVVPVEAVRMSEVEIANDNGEAYGYGVHYVERADGIYIIYDSVPMEISPLLKNNMINGLSWNYEDSFGKVIWTVVDMGVTLDLGFAKLDNCLLIEEDNQAVGIKKIVYYAPGMGRVMEKTSQGGADLLKLTAYSKVNLLQAVEQVKKWSPNYETIQDDRTQS